MISKRFFGGIALWRVPKTNSAKNLFDIIISSILNKNFISRSTVYLVVPTNYLKVFNTLFRVSYLCTPLIPMSTCRAIVEQPSSSHCRAPIEQPSSNHRTAVEQPSSNCSTVLDGCSMVAARRLLNHCSASARWD